MNKKLKVHWSEAGETLLGMSPQPFLVLAEELWGLQ